MFVTLATEKVQRLLPEEALKAVRERSRCTGKRRTGRKKEEEVVSDGQEGGALRWDRSTSERGWGVQEVLVKTTGEF